MKKHQINYLRIAAIVAFLFNHQLSIAQWPQWRGLMRDGFSTESNLLKVWPAEGPRLAWSSDTIGDGYASAIIQKNAHLLYDPSWGRMFWMIDIFYRHIIPLGLRKPMSIIRL